MVKPPKKKKRVRNAGYSLAQIAQGLTPLEASIAEWEEYLPTMVRDELAGGLPTIGFGFADPEVVKRYSNGITLNLAKAELKVQVNRARNNARSVIGASVWDKLNLNQQDALTSYYYNFPFHNNPKGPKKWYSPKMVGAIQRGDFQEAARQMDAGWNQAPGLRRRRIQEQKLFLTPVGKAGVRALSDIDLTPEDMEYIYNMLNIQPLTAQEQAPVLQYQQPLIILVPLHMPANVEEYPKQETREYQPILGSTPQEYLNTFQGLFGEGLQQQAYAYAAPNYYYPIMEDYRLPQYAYGKDSIYIKPENRGKFTETMRRTGKTAEELSHSNNPLTRKRAIFALNARKWNH